MSYVLKNDLGTLEAVIDDNCGMKKFYSVANSLHKDFKIKFIGKHDEFESINWEFKYKGHFLTLHYNIYNGVSICTDNAKDNEVVNELAKMLENKYF